MNDSSVLATYLIQYVGCIPITISFKSLNFQERTQITRECIMRVCEDVGLRVPPARPISSNGLSKFIGRGTDLAWTRQSVRLIISVDGVTVQDFHSDQVILFYLSNLIFNTSQFLFVFDELLKSTYKTFIIKIAFC
ncbi:unnamed protein product [Hymenolepis diminuta]|uniref:PID domain-containing protein n=1 Tax=Hymenolepis diminuta TaxID=6216 RepID=A0A0R3SWZ2_HYMDI|nr:unnamed protein product [Hymenolepis diminuta]